MKSFSVGRAPPDGVVEDMVREEEEVERWRWREAKGGMRGRKESSVVGGVRDGKEGEVGKMVGMDGKKEGEVEIGRKL